MKNGDFPQFFVSLPEGNHKQNHPPKLVYFLRPGLIVTADDGLLFAGGLLIPNNVNVVNPIINHPLKKRFKTIPNGRSHSPVN